MTEAISKTSAKLLLSDYFLRHRFDALLEVLIGYVKDHILCQERNGSEGIPSSKLEGILLLFYYF